MHFLFLKERRIAHGLDRCFCTVGPVIGLWDIPPEIGGFYFETWRQG